MGIVLVKSRPHPWFVCGVKYEPILWTTLVHYLSFLPELAAVTLVKAKTVHTLEASQQLIVVSFMGYGTLPTVGAFGSAISMLVAEPVALETYDWLPVQALQFDKFVEDIRTLFEDCVCRLWTLVEDMEGRYLLACLPVYCGLDPLRCEYRFDRDIVVVFVLPNVLFVRRVIKYREEVDYDLIGVVSYACAGNQVLQEFFRCVTAPQPVCSVGRVRLN